MRGCRLTSGCGPARDGSLLREAGTEICACHFIAEGRHLSEQARGGLWSSRREASYLHMADTLWICSFLTTVWPLLWLFNPGLCDHSCLIIRPAWCSVLESPDFYHFFFPMRKFHSLSSSFLEESLGTLLEQSPK